MNKLNQQQKLFIIRHLAMGAFPSEVVKFFLAEFGIALTRGTIQKYDPRTVAGRSLSKELKETFNTEHSKFLKALEAVPVANKNVRLSVIDRQLDEALNDGDRRSIVKLLDLGRKETADYYMPDEQPDEGEGDGW